MTPYDGITPERIKAEMLDHLTAGGAAIETREGSYTNTLVSVLAYQLYRLYQSFPGLLAACFPGPDSGPYLDRHAAQIGMSRTGGQKAAVTLTLTGTPGTEVPSGTGFYAPGPGLRFVTVAEVVLTEGSAEVQAEAAEAGSAYNLSAGEISAMYETLPGIKTVQNAAPSEGGTDQESDEALWHRYHLRRAMPVASGNRYHYITWALEVPGVAHAGCVPLWQGPGTVQVLIAGPGREPVDESIRAACAAHIEAERPIGATVTVQSVRSRSIPVVASVVLMPGFSTADVEEQLRSSVHTLLLSQPFGEPVEVPFSRFLACLLQSPGVADYTVFTVDGAASAAVVLAAEDAADVGTVEVREVTR